MTPPDATAPLARKINAARPRKKPLLHRRFPLLVLLALATVAGYYLWQHRQNTHTATPAYATAPIQRGNLRITRTATGNLEPTTQVTIGSELSGIVLEVKADTNDRVRKGDILATLDTTKLVQQTTGSRAALATAQARIAQAQATQTETQATLARHQELHRLTNGRMPSRTEMDAAQAAAARATADLALATATTDEARAQLAIHETDLAKAHIKSPIDGIVLTRNIEPGQTVAASFTAPELFVIAEDLTQMKLNVAVVEADIGRVAAGQQATFTVDAWPNRHYTATVLKVAYSSTIKDNLVTYETELQVANTDLTLRPGMTATASIQIAENKNTLLIPSAALRFIPETDDTPAAPIGQQKKTFLQNLIPSPSRRGTRRPAPHTTTATTTPPPDGTAFIYTLRDGAPEPLTVKVGLSDGRLTEISGKNIAEGLPIILRATR
ncbi:MAG: efflux RND transporter periplasmic adaptor subunit [Puniceicoccales bacterium]|jgi:HlyD family secretion protein|nr:efflux RND transporter periplasmic adaptor subunit [Puniceicoccales bacterium]